MREYGTFVRLKNIEDAESSFLRLKDLGFSYCHLVYKPKEYCKEDAIIIKQVAQRVGVKIVALFAGFYDSYTKWDIYGDYKIAGINSKKYGRARLKYIKSASVFAKELDVSDVLIHAGFIANNPFSKEYLYMKKRVKEFASYCKAIGINVLLETGGESPVTMLRLIKEIGLDNIYVNLDTANIIMYGYGSPTEAVVTLGKLIRSVHIKDGAPPVDPYKLGIETVVGEGYVDFKRVFNELDKVDFNGPIIIEREIDGEKQLSDIKRAVDYLEKALS